jgi:DNA repair exonuclease SbcCD ATPase subunit
MAVTIDQIQVLIGAQTKELEKKIDSVRGNLKGLPKDVKPVNAEFAKLGKTLAGVFTVAALIKFTKSVIDATSQLQRLRAVMESTLGSKSQAALGFSEILQYDKITIFGLNEITESFQLLVANGIKPTKDELEAIGDIAANFGKTFSDASQSIISAMNGNFQSLKKFGITARQAGDEVEVTFKGVTTTIQRSEKAIYDYIISLGKLEGVAGSTRAIAETLGGQIDIITDNLTLLFSTLGDGTDGALNQFAKGLNTVLERMVDMVKTTKQLGKELAVEAFGEFVSGLGIDTESIKNTEQQTKAIEQVTKKMGELRAQMNALITAPSSNVSFWENVKWRFGFTPKAVKEANAASAAIFQLIELLKDYEKELAGLTFSGGGAQVGILTELQKKIEDINKSMLDASKAELPALLQKRQALLEQYQELTTIKDTQKEILELSKKIAAESLIAAEIGSLAPIKNLYKELDELIPKLMTTEQILEMQKQAMQELTPEVLDYATAWDAMDVDSQNALLQQMNGLIGGAIGGFTTLFDTLLGGGNILKAFGQMIKQLIARMAAMAVVAAILSAISGGTSAIAGAAGAFGGSFKDIFGTLSGLSGMGQAARPMASGGIAYGPTNALIGEYAGARSNPEVVAPLNKLKSMLGDMGGGSYTFRIQGTDLIAVLNRSERFMFRTTT